jgi:hypothetical protein
MPYDLKKGVPLTVNPATSEIVFQVMDPVGSKSEIVIFVPPAYHSCKFLQLPLAKLPLMLRLKLSKAGPEKGEYVRLAGKRKIRRIFNLVCLNAEGKEVTRFAPPLEIMYELTNWDRTNKTGTDFQPYFYVKDSGKWRFISYQDALKATVPGLVVGNLHPLKRTGKEFVAFNLSDWQPGDSECDGDS